MTNKRLRTALLLSLGLGAAGGCSQPLDLCGDQGGACLTVEVTADEMSSAPGSIDLLRALYTVSSAATQERQFAGPAGGAALPLGFELALPMGGNINVDVIAESALRPVLHGSAQATLGPTDHQMVTIPLTADLTNLPYAGPQPRHHAAIAYFPPRQSYVLFGGTAGDGTLLGDTWELDASGKTWTQVIPSGATPTPRNSTLTYDPAASLLVMAGGTGTGGAPTPDMWTYDQTGTWSMQVKNGGGGNRTGAGQTVTDVGIAIVAGGQNAGVLSQDILTSDSAKSRAFPDFTLRTGMLPKIKSPRLFFLSSTQGVYVVGADEATAPAGGITLWQISGALAAPLQPLTVTAVAGSELNAPSRRTDYSLAVDSTAGLLYLFGGISVVGGQYLQDAYVFNLTTRKWAAITPTTQTVPLPRAGAQLVVVSPTLYLFGGLAGPAAATPIALDSWTLTPGPPDSSMMPMATGTYNRHL
jgi:hypothetical protein